MTGGSVPSLWTALAAAAAAVCALDALCAWRRDLERRRRMHGLLVTKLPEQVGSAAGRRGRRPGGAAGRAVAALRSGGVLALAVPAVLAFGVIVVGGVPGVLGGCAAAYAGGRWLRRRAGERLATAARRDAKVSAAQLPLAAELLAACFAAGSGPGEAAAAVGHSLPGPLGDRLLRAATELRLGGDPGVVWERFGALAGHEGLGRCMERAATTGVPAVEPVSRLAGEWRARRARTAAARARRASVLVTGPLGLCFLPAFLAVGVVPVVLGLADSLL